MPRRATIVVLSAFAAACSGGAAKPAPAPAEHSLAGTAAQHVAVLPTYAVRVMPGLGWSLPSPADMRRQMDADIVAAMDDRGLRKSWVFPEQLAQSYRRNVNYAVDPYELAEEPLRSPALDYDTQLPDPIASQIRTIVALQADVRLVLAPVELRFEKAGSAARGVLHLVLLDARASRMLWKGDVASDTVTAFGPSITASIAARLAGVIAPQ
jgi:hypothetical protein